MYEKGFLPVDIPVASLGINQKVAHMHLICPEVEAPDVPVSGHPDFNDAVTPSTVLFGYEGAEIPGSPSRSGSRKLDADRDTVPGWNSISFKLRSQFDAEILSVDHTGRGIVNRKDREFLESPGRRHVFVPQLREAVVGRHKEIVAGDVMVLPEGKTMTVDRQREHVPLLLDKRGERPPGLQRTKMNRLRLQLAQGARKLRMRPLLPVADAVPVIERNITH